MESTEQTEADWIVRCQRGDKEAFSFLVKRYMRPAYYTALSYVGAHEDALDLSQEAFAKAYIALPRFEVGKKFYTWYYQILKNLCLNHIRNRKGKAVSFSSSHLTQDDNEDTHDPESPDEPPDIQLERKELREQVWTALWQLDPSDRQLIVARDILNTSYEMLAELMDCPLGTVMSRLYYARKKLKQRLQENM
ncbi:MAG: sigma-70 family RNA polymerase sigma factor [bacterium]